MLYNLLFYNLFLPLYRNPEIQDAPVDWALIIVIMCILIGGGCYMNSNNEEG